MTEETRVEDIKVISKDIAERLSESGAKFEAYARSPVEGANFLVRRQGNKKIKVFSTTLPEINIATSRRYNQAVISVEEERKVLSRTINITIPRLRGSIVYTGPEQLRTTLIDNKVLGDKSHIKLVEEDEKDVIHKIREEPEKSHEVLAKETITLPKSENNFLVGIDEVAHFISVLPKRAESVEHAHEILRPKSVEKGTIRQGEFFFVKIGPRETRKILSKGARSSSSGYDTILEPRSSHFSDFMVHYKKERYVSGRIRDVSRNRHKDLFLPDGWYRVVRNNEIVQKEKARYYD